MAKQTQCDELAVLADKFADINSYCITTTSINVKLILGIIVFEKKKKKTLQTIIRRLIQQYRMC